MTPLPRDRAWLIAVAVFAVLIACTFTVVYVGRVVRQQCGMLRLQADESPAPTTPRGRDQQQEAKRLFREYRC